MWMALALAVPRRLWLGGVLSPRRDGGLIEAPVRQVKACVTNLAILVGVYGLASYVTAFRRMRGSTCGGRTADHSSEAAGLPLQPARVVE